MDILIRDLDVMVVQRIDEMAKKKRVSRNEFLKEQLAKTSFLDVLINERKRFEEVVHINQKVLEQYLENQRIMVEKVKRLEAMVLLLMDTDDEEMNELLKMFAGKGETKFEKG